MSSLLLYSTNVHLKLLIQEKYRKNLHWVWCSESFDSTKQPGYSLGSLVAPSSNPVDIYREIKRDVDRGDTHSAKIRDQRTSFKALAVKWQAAGEITRLQEQEIVHWVDTAHSSLWRPLIYVIPRPADPARVKLVDVTLRASIADEFIIEDLDRSEFDVLEF